MQHSLPVPSGHHGRVYKLSKCDDDAVNGKSSCKELSLRQAIEKKHRENSIVRKSSQIGKVAISPFIVYKGRHGTLNLVDCEISVIDDLSTSVDDVFSFFYRGPIVTLYLSNNLISSLDGIGQEIFLTITKLSLSNNKIYGINDLLPLSKLALLTTLSLNGNPVTLLPYYKQEVLTICTRLVSLDGVSINSPADFLIAQSCIYQHRERIKSFAEVEIKKYILTRWLQWCPILAEIRNPQQKLRQKPVLRIAWSGGLGSWIQIMSGDSFEREVRTLLNQKGVKRKKRPNHFTRPQSDRSDDEKSHSTMNNVKSDIKRWDDFMREFSLQQCQQLLYLEESCYELMSSRKAVLQRSTIMQSVKDLFVPEDECKDENMHAITEQEYYENHAVDTIEVPRSALRSNTSSILSDPERKIKQQSLSLRSSSDKENILETASVSSKASTSTAKMRSAEDSYEILQEKMVLLKKKQVQRQQEIQDRYTELLQTHLRTEEKRRSVAIRMSSKAIAKHSRNDAGDTSSPSISQSVLHLKDLATCAKIGSRNSDRVIPIVQSHLLSIESSDNTGQTVNGTPSVALFKTNTNAMSFNSSVLPVQQCEPDDVVEKVLTSPNPFLEYVQSFSNRASDRLVLNSETLSDDPRVLEAWVLLGEEMAGFLRGITSDFTAYAATNADRLDLNLVTQQQAQPSMRSLKSDVQRAIQEQSLLQRQEFVGRDVNSILHSSLREFHDKCQTMYSSFLNSLSEGSSNSSSSQEDNDLLNKTNALRKEITSVAADIMQCERDNWTDQARSIVSAYDNLRTEVTMSQQSLSDAEARLRLIDSALADAQDVQERLLNSNSEVTRALGDIHGYIRASSDLQHLLIVFSRLTKSPTMDLETASLMSRTLMKKCFDKLVLNTSRNLRLKESEARVFEKSKRKTYFSYFHWWYHMFQIETIYSRFIKKRDTSTKRHFYSLWKSRIIRSHRLKKHLCHQRFLSMTRVLKDWKIFSVRSNIETRRSAQYDLCVRLYLTLKAFRGWKSFVTSSMASMQRTFLEVWKKKSYWAVFGAWKTWKQSYEEILSIIPVVKAVPSEVTSQRRRLLTALNDLLVTNRLQICWRRWTSLYSFRVQLCLYRAKKRGLQLFMKSFRELKHRNLMNEMRFHTAIERRNKRCYRKLSWFVSFLRRRRQKGIIRQRRILAVLTLRKLKSMFLKWLKQFLVRVGQNVSKYTESIPLILKSGQSGLDAVRVVPSKRGIEKDIPRRNGWNSISREREQSFPQKLLVADGQQRLPTFNLCVGRFRRQSTERLRSRCPQRSTTDQTAMLEDLESRVQKLSSKRLLLRYFQILSQAFLRSHWQQCNRYRLLTDRCKQIEDEKIHRDEIQDEMNAPAYFSESSTSLIAEKLSNLDIQIEKFLRERLFIRNGRRDSEKEEDQISAATQLRVETDQLQTELSDLESQIHNVDLTRADLQSSVNALQHSVDDSRVQLGEFSSQEVLFYEQQQHLAVLSSVKKLEPAFPPSAASSHTGGTGEGLDHLRNMEDLYNEAVTNLSAATVHTDQVDDILSARKVRLSALRSQLQEKDLICEEMRQQKNNFQQMAQDVAKSVEFTLRKMAAQAVDYDQQIAALDAEATEMEREQQELLAAEQRLRAFQAHRHGLTAPQVHQLVALPQQGAFMPFQTATKESYTSTQRIQGATPLPDVALPTSFQESYALPSVPFSSQQMRSNGSVGKQIDIADDELGGRIKAVTARIRERLNSAI